MGRSITDGQASRSDHIGPHTEEAAVMAGKSAEHLYVGIEPRLRPRDHRAADTWLGGVQCDGSYADLLPDP
jgi:hypothetical protein